MKCMRKIMFYNIHDCGPETDKTVTGCKYTHICGGVSWTGQRAPPVDSRVQTLATETQPQLIPIATRHGRGEQSS